MEANQAISKFLHLPPAAQRIVAELIEYLDRDTQRPAASAASEGATLLPPIDISNAATTWPENEFANPEFFGAWADRDDITDSTEFVRKLRREQWSTGE